MNSVTGAPVRTSRGPAVHRAIHRATGLIRDFRARVPESGRLRSRGAEQGGFCVSEKVFLRSMPSLPEKSHIRIDGEKHGIKSDGPPHSDEGR